MAAQGFSLDRGPVPAAFVDACRIVGDGIPPMLMAAVARKIIQTIRRGHDPSPSPPTGDTPDAKEDQAQDLTAPAPVLAIPEDHASSFSHIFERDSQIAIVRSAIEAAQASGFRNRFHCVLYGPPACGKTEILQAFKRMLGPDCVLQLDATAMTQAGAIRILLESARIPPVLLIEEIEKVGEEMLRWLLGVLDHRGEIRKTNFNVGNVQREVKMLCLATANDIQSFELAMSGALASRFAHRLFCPRPSRTVLERILEREIGKASGRGEWIKPALEYCARHERTDDPRRVVAVCLSGRDGLLTGEYQRHLQATRRPEAVVARRALEASAALRLG